MGFLATISTRRAEDPYTVRVIIRKLKDFLRILSLKNQTGTVIEAWIGLLIHRCAVLYLAIVMAAKVATVLVGVQLIFGRFIYIGATSMMGNIKQPWD